MSNQTKISIVIPVFNRSDLLHQTIASITNQTHDNWECILIDDGSDSEEFEKILSISKLDNRIKLFKRDTINKGPSSCRNLGMSKSTGEYLMFLDSDDLLLRNCLKNRIEQFVSFPDNDFIVFNHIFFHKEVGDSLLQHQVPSEKHWEAFLNYKYPWCTSSPIWKSKYVKSFLFDEKMTILEDIAFHITILYQEPHFGIVNASDWAYRLPEKLKVYTKPTVIECTGQLLDSISELCDNKSLKLFNQFIISSVWGFTTQKSQIPALKKLIYRSLKINIITWRQYWILQLYIQLFQLGFMRIRGMKSVFLLLFKIV